MDRTVDAPPRTYFTVDEAAHYLGITKHMVYKMIERREIPFIPYGRLRRLDRDELDEWVRKRMVKATI